jgi:hypothetical protein
MKKKTEKGTNKDIKNNKKRTKIEETNWGKNENIKIE